MGREELELLPDVFGKETGGGDKEVGFISRNDEGAPFFKGTGGNDLLLSTETELLSVQDEDDDIGEADGAQGFGD